MWWCQGWNKKKKKIGHVMFELISSMSWRRRRWGNTSCASSRHQYNVEWRNVVQDQDEPSRRDHMLDAFHSNEDHGYVKALFERRGLSHRNMGEQFACLHRAIAIKKESPSWDEQDRHHLAQVDHAQGKGMILIGFLSYRSRHDSCETGLWEW